MNEYFEIDEKQKTVKILNLDDLSIEDLNIYLNELNNEIHRVNKEIERKNKIKIKAEEIFK